MITIKTIVDIIIMLIVAILGAFILMALIMLLSNGLANTLTPIVYTTFN